MWHVKSDHSHSKKRKSCIDGKCNECDVQPVVLVLFTERFLKLRNLKTFIYHTKQDFLAKMGHVSKCEVHSSVETSKA